MPSKERRYTENLEKMLDFLGDHIRSAPEDELIEAARDEGRDPGEENTRLKSLLLNICKSHQQKKLAEAREGYKRELDSLSERDFNLPGSADERKALFIAALAHARQLQPAFTLQHRDLSEFSDEDIQANLKKLAQLGLLPHMDRPEGK
jgi:hypothetical protein